MKIKLIKTILHNAESSQILLIRLLMKSSLKALFQVRLSLSRGEKVSDNISLFKHLCSGNSG